MEKALYWYRIYGNVLCSQLELPQLLTTGEQTADIELLVMPLERKTEKLTDCFVDKVTRDRIYFCNQVGVFEITEGRRIAICPNPDVETEKLIPFVLGYGMAMLFWQRGMHAIHCSAVEYNGKSILIAGYSGSGKSTLTSRLLDNGFRLLADDVAILKSRQGEKVTVYPAFPQQKLCRDAVIRNKYDVNELWYIDEDKDKFAVARRDIFCEKATELVGVIYLSVNANTEHVEFCEIKGHAKLISILENHFLFPMFRQNQVFSSEDMSCCLWIAQSVPMYSVKRPEGIDSTLEQLSYIKELML